MPALGNALDFNKYEGRNLRAHQLGANPSAPVTGQLYYNTADNTLYWWDGSQWVSARGGAIATPPATTGSLGTIQLAGDLAGTAASPQIAAGVITDSEVAAANKDGAVGTASMRTLGAGAQQAMPGNRTLDAISPPVAVMNINGQVLASVGNPVLAADGVNKQYVDNIAQGLDAKLSCKVASTANIAALTGFLTIDGYVTQANDRVLVKDQTDQTQNGIYVAASGAWQRATDADVMAELISAYVFVERGTTNADTGWVCTTDQGTITITAITWTQFSGAGSITAGAGLTKTGNSLDVGAGAGITVNADTIQVANNGITNAMIADGAIDLNSNDTTNTLPINKGGTGSITASDSRLSLGTAGYYTNLGVNGTSATIVLPQSSHGLRAGRGLHVQCQDNITGAVEYPDVVVAANGDVTITYGAALTTNSKLITIVG